MTDDQVDVPTRPVDQSGQDDVSIRYQIQYPVLIHGQSLAQAG